MDLKEFTKEALRIPGKGIMRRYWRNLTGTKERHLKGWFGRRGVRREVRHEALTKRMDEYFNKQREAIGKTYDNPDIKASVHAELKTKGLDSHSPEYIEAHHKAWAKHVDPAEKEAVKGVNWRPTNERLGVTLQKSSDRSGKRWGLRNRMLDNARKAKIRTRVLTGAGAAGAGAGLYATLRKKKEN